MSDTQMEEMDSYIPDHFMVFAPNKQDVGAKPYGQPSADPNKAIMSAVKRHFGCKDNSWHQQKALWRFMYDRGFRCRKILEIHTDEFIPEWFEKDTARCPAIGIPVPPAPDTKDA
jgi:hypothetical protein